MLKLLKLSSSLFRNATKSGGQNVSRSFCLSSSVLQQQQNKVILIDDLNKGGVEAKTPDELARCKLASLYRLVDEKGWSQSIYNHITVRSETNPDHFYLNPYGLLYSEITASSLLKINSQCDIIEQGSTTFGINNAGFVLHSTIHDCRPDVNAVLHVHTGPGAGISTLKCGLLPISQEALICGKVGYHDYEGILVDENMKKQIASDLGQSQIMILRNHGAVFCGATLEEAYFWLITFMTAVEIQFHAMSAANGQENLTLPGPHVQEQVSMVIKMAEKMVNSTSSDRIKWGLGGMELEAEMRQLDRQGFSTGYPYKKPFTA